MEFLELAPEVVLLASNKLAKTLQLQVPFKHEVPKVIFENAPNLEVRTFFSFFSDSKISPGGEVIVLIESQERWVVEAVVT